MSADSLRKGVINKVPGHTVRPQAVSEKTFMESVAGLINEVGLAPQPYGHNEDAENMVAWAKFEGLKQSDLKGINGFPPKTDPSQHASPLLLTVGYPGGVQMWAINTNGEANEVLSWKRPSVKLFQMLPTPGNEERDQYRNSRPIAAVCEGSGTSNYITFLSLRTGESLKSSKYIQSVLDIVANQIAIAISFLDKIIVLDPGTLETKITISQLGIIPNAPTHNPVSLGPTWLAYTDRRLFPRYQSGGGVEMAGSLSYTASMLYAAKSLTKGLKGLGETVASSITGHRVPGRNENVAPEPGIVTVINLTDLKPGEFCLSDTSTGNSAMHTPVIAHFVAHRQSPVTSLSFDPSGMLVVTADRQGHDFNVFRIHPHPLSSALGNVQHLYVLHRGDTVAKVQNISFAPDSRWVAVSTLRGTTHVFPITPYGGQISARTHTSHKVVNRLSRFHRTAGLDDASTSGRHSPSPATAFGTNPPSTAPTSVKTCELSQPANSFSAPTPFPHPLTITPMAQLRQDTSGLSSSSSPRSSPPVTKAKTFLQDERSIVVSIFGEPRSQPIFNTAIVAGCDKRKKSAVDSLFVMTCFGNLIEYLLDPKPSPDSLQRNSLHGKVSDDTTIELTVHAKVQWKLTKPSFTKELQLPLQPNNILISLNSGSDMHHNSKKANAPDAEENIEERWLSQVEITTHHGPHRRLWMGPQFTFKVFNPSILPGMPKMGVHDIETVEVNVTNRPARSNPVNMPVYSSLLPFVIEDSSGSSLEQSPRLVDPYCQSDAVVVNNDSLIKENIADAMMENAGLNPRETGGCQSQGLGSCDDLSSGSSIDSSSQASGDAPLASSFCIDAGFPFPD